MTGRHVAVLTPAPNGAALIRPGVRARGLALFGDETRNIAQVSAAASAPWFARTLPGAPAEHAVAVTTVATQPGARPGAAGRHRTRGLTGLRALNRVRARLVFAALLVEVLALAAMAVAVTVSLWPML
ncbi:hypothetical protein [Actinophytocola algeriensis]|uniref:Uncharacterized protein n=1 Tax=Actinophytocola algeriensis TaxID=1768010 RepID=A0A7W7Q266_9PSEU|nr:hypothetical protein [Actinophytocola algeriensis]MBB4905586.1 hypothetical protein [Actinophytocola algeriensis]MBE1472729.1 hypothetical protein [Actinophytocola algeriensis]